MHLVKIHKRVSTRPCDLYILVGSSEGKTRRRKHVRAADGDIGPTKGDRDLDGESHSGEVCYSQDDHWMCGREMKKECPLLWIGEGAPPQTAPRTFGIPFYGGVGAAWLGDEHNKAMKHRGRCLGARLPGSPQCQARKFRGAPLRGST